MGPRSRRVQPNGGQSKLVGVKAECKTAFGLVSVGRYRAPIHLVDTRAQGFYAHSHHVAVHLRLTLADFDAVRVRHSEVRECGLKRVRECERHLLWSSA